MSLDVGEIRNTHAINHTEEINMRYSLVHDQLFPFNKHEYRNLEN